MGLFDQIKQGTIGLFGGHAGGGQALQQAGAAALVGGDDFASGLGHAVMAGQAAGESIKRQAIEDQNRAQLAQLVNEVGMDREGLMKVFLTAVGNGQIDEARSISEILKSLPKTAMSQPEMDFIEKRVMNPETGKWEWMSFGRDKYTGEVVRRDSLGEAPPENDANLKYKYLGSEVAPGGAAGMYAVRENLDGTITPTDVLDLDDPEFSILDAAAGRLDTLQPEDWIRVGGLGATLERMRGDGWFDRGLRFVGGMMTDEQTELANSAAGMALMGVQQDLSGKQMTESERVFMDGFMMPRYTDHDDVKMTKGEYITTYVKARATGMKPGEALRATVTVHPDLQGPAAQYLNDAAAGGSGNEDFGGLPDLPIGG